MSPGVQESRKKKSLISSKLGRLLSIKKKVRKQMKGLKHTRNSWIIDNIGKNEGISLFK